jgi:hypothetical protein
LAHIVKTFFCLPANWGFCSVVKPPPCFSFGFYLVLAWACLLLAALVLILCLAARLIEILSLTDTSIYLGYFAYFSFILSFPDIAICFKKSFFVFGREASRGSFRIQPLCSRASANAIYWHARIPLDKPSVSLQIKQNTLVSSCIRPSDHRFF